ncbi:sensor histidine kinase [Amedibacillus sp. YH-ame10]
MKLSEYLEDQASFLITMFLVLIVQSLILYFLGNNLSMIIVLDGMWGIFFITYLNMQFRKKHKQHMLIRYLEETLDQKYLLHEVLPQDMNHEEQFYKHLLYVGNKSMLEHVSSIRRERKEYQEFIEQWVHEVKTPIAAMKLWSENQQVERKRDLMQQIERTEHYVEQALYYARSENVEKDFHIHAFDLMKGIQESLLKNKYLCMCSQVRIEMPSGEYCVYTDEKWVIFILNQLIENAVKYRKSEDAFIRIEIQKVNEHTYLRVIDNGKGIQAQDLPRVFEKGFTGENGRVSNKHSTGIGLYLCKRLCDALSIGIEIQSVEGEYTEVILCFS